MRKSIVTATILLSAFFFISTVAVAEELRIGIATEPWDLDPAIRTDTGSGYIIQNVYDPLLELDPDNQVTTENAVCDGWEWKGQMKGLTLKIKKGIQFHDGSDLTAADVKYNIDWQIDEDNSAPNKGLLGPVESVTLVDDYTLEVRFKGPYPDALMNWARALDGIVPEGGHGKRSDEKGAGGIAGTELSRNPVGSGPYKFVKWVSGSSIVLEKNDNYWMDDFVQADKVVFEFIGDEAAKLAALISGSVQIVDKVPYRDYDTIKRMPQIVTARIPGIQTQLIYINLSAPPFGVSAEGADDPAAIEKAYNLRKFLFHAIDREEIADEIFYGMASLQYGPWYADSEWTSPKLKKITLHDPELAKEYLAKAGYENKPFSFRMMATNAQWFVDVATLIQEQLRKYNVSVEVIPIDKSAFFDTMYETEDWDTGMEDWGLNNFSALSWLYSGYYRNNHNHNHWHHAADDLKDHYHPSVPGHKEFSELYDKAEVTVDREERKKLVWQMEEMVTEKVIQIDMMFLDNLHAWRKGVEGYGDGLNSQGDINLRFITALQ